MKYIKKIINLFIVILILILCLFSTVQSLNIDTHQEKKFIMNNKTFYDLTTEDSFIINLTRYKSSKMPSILLIHGYACNKKIFDWDNNHSLARYLNKNQWDVWNLALRTHDADGDFLFDKNSNREYICRFWDFDRTYLKKDLVTAVEFIKKETQQEKIFLIGHSMGGYLCYAYAELISQDDLAGIVTIASSAIGYSYNIPYLYLLKYGFKFGKKAYINPFSFAHKHFSKFRIKNFPTEYPYFFFKNITSKDIQEKFLFCLDDEPTGVFVDIIFGKENRFYNGCWVDPQSLYDYTKNLYKINVPCLLISGDEDIIDPLGDVFTSYVKIGSSNKKFEHIANYAHMDLLLGDNASIDVFSKITCWLNSI